MNAFNTPKLVLIIKCGISTENNLILGKGIALHFASFLLAILMESRWRSSLTEKLSRARTCYASGEGREAVQGEGHVASAATRVRPRLVPVNGFRAEAAVFCRDRPHLHWPRSGVSCRGILALCLAVPECNVSFRYVRLTLNTHHDRDPSV